jgi:hypothetical protein
MKALSQGHKPVLGSDSAIPMWGHRPHSCRGGAPGTPERPGVGPQKSAGSRFGLLRAIAVWTALVTAASLAAAQAPAPGTPTLIAMTLETDRADYYPGEPVVLTCHLVNWQSPQLLIQGAFGLQSQATDLRIFRNGEMSDTYRGSSHESPMTPDRIETHYAKTFEFRMIACYDPARRSAMALDTPGEYYFNLTQMFLISDHYRDFPVDHGVKIEGQSSPVAVVEPSDASAAALKLLRTNPHCFEDLGRQAATPATAWIFRKIVADCPQTRYTPYCLLSLAHQCMSLGANLPEETEQGVAYLRQIVEHYPAFPLRLDAQAALADAMLATHHPELSRKIVEDLIEESPDNLTRLRMHACAAPFLGPSPNPHLRTNQAYWFLFDTTQLVDAYEQRNPGGAAEEKKQ